jgi:hypothetical protein
MQAQLLLNSLHSSFAIMSLFLFCGTDAERWVPYAYPLYYQRYS